MKRYCFFILHEDIPQSRTWVLLIRGSSAAPVLAMSDFFSRLAFNEESSSRLLSHDAGVAGARAWARRWLAETGGRLSPCSSGEDPATGCYPVDRPQFADSKTTTGRHPYSRLGSPAASFGLSAYFPCIRQLSGFRSLSFPLAGPNSQDQGPVPLSAYSSASWCQVHPSL